MVGRGRRVREPLRRGSDTALCSQAATPAGGFRRHPAPYREPSRAVESRRRAEPRTRRNARAVITKQQSLVQQSTPSQP